MEQLQYIYINYLRVYNETALKPRLDEMLLILLLEERDCFEPLKVTLRDFYRFYQRIINEKIAKIKTDFNLTEEDIVEQKKQKEIQEKDEYFFIEDILEIIHNYTKDSSYVTPIEIYYQYYELLYGMNPIKREKNQSKVLSKFRKVDGVNKWISKK